MKAVIVEMLDDNHAWSWFKVHRLKTPTQAIRAYLDQHSLNVKARIVKDRDTYYCDEGEVRAYKINIEA